MCVSPLYITKTDCFGVSRTYRCRCGKCASCQKQTKRDWEFRLLQEKRSWTQGVFVTLTYAPWSIPVSKTNRPTLYYRDVQLFLKRLRLQCGNIRFYCCGEYGKEKGRPHYHLLIFGLPSTRAVNKIISNCWNLGYVYTGYDFSPRTVSYVSKYVQKQGAIKHCSALKGSDYWCDLLGVTRPFRHMSQGIGKNYLTSEIVSFHLGISTHPKNDFESIPIYINFDKKWSTPNLSVKVFTNKDNKEIFYPLPRYYRRKIFEQNYLNIYNYEYSQYRLFKQFMYDSTIRSYLRCYNNSCSSVLACNVSDLYSSVDTQNFEQNIIKESRIIKDLQKDLLDKPDLCDLSQLELNNNDINTIVKTRCLPIFI